MVRAGGCDLSGVVDDRHPVFSDTWRIGLMTSHLNGLAQKGRACGSKGIGDHAVGVMAKIRVESESR